jgi:hypothetical protein
MKLKRFLRVNRTFFIYMAFGMACSLLGMAFSNCSFINSFSEDDFTVNSITFNKTALEIPRGAMDMLSITMEPPDAQARALVTWEYDSAVIRADTDNFGMVLTGLRSGETIVRVTGYGKTASCVVTVLPGSGEPDVLFPYIYSNTECIEVSPGNTIRAAASLYGGNPSDSNGFTFTIDKPNVAALTAEGNYVWITGQNEGIAKVTVRHAKAAYGFSFLVSCQADSRAVPYITTNDNIVTINKSLENEASFMVDLQNPPAAASDGLFTWSLVDAAGIALANAPVSLFAGGKQAALTALRPGECYVQVTHPAAPYPLNVLVRVIEQIDTVYIEPSAAVLRLSGTSSGTLSVSLGNLPPGITAKTSEFHWSFPEGAEEYLDWKIYGGDTEGGGDTAWFTAKKTGTLVFSVRHPLAVQKRDILMVIRDTAEEAAKASTYISTSQNYIETKVGDLDTFLAIYVNNAPPGEEEALSWWIEHDAADGSDNPVIAWISGTGKAAQASAARSAVPVASGHALISPLRAGKAAVTISHPKAVYAAKILVTVLPAGSNPAVPFALAADTPYVTIKNGSSLDLTVRLQGIDKKADDERDINWLYNGRNLSIQANGTAASVTATGGGTSRETITVSHPKAAYPLSIAVLRYDTEAERDGAKYMYTETPYYALTTGETAYLAVRTVNLSPADTLSWQITSGASCIAVTQLDKSNAALTAVSPGTAAVTVTLAGTGEPVTFYITVKREGVVNGDVPCYLTTSQNVILLEPGGEADITVVPVNISESGYTGLQWSVSDASLIGISANGSQATVQSIAGGGKAVITVSHPLSSNTLELNVHIGDEYEYINTDTAYIDTSADTLLLRAGDEDTPLRAVLAHTEQAALTTTGFSFSIQNTGIAAVSWSSNSNTCFIAPKSPGQTILTISHAEAVYDKEVLIIVDRAAGDSGTVPYITTTQNVITVISGDYTTAAVSLVNKEAYDSAAWDWKSQDTRIAQVVVNNGAAAMIRGDTPGTTFITVAHEDSPYPLRLIVICLDAALIQSKPWIQTSTSIVTVKAGSSLTVSADMAGGDETDYAFFAWSAADSSVALLSGTGNAVSVRGVTAGITYITVRNTRYPDSYTKTVLVLVENAVRDGVYITVNQRIVKMKPEAKEAVTLTAALVGGEVLDPQHFIWWADDYSVVSLESVTDTARIEPRGVSGSTAVHVKHPKALETVDIVVLVSAFEEFGFESGSKTIRKGAIAFIPMEKPAASEQTVIEYTSADSGVCAVTGSNAVCMIAGVSDGYTVITAALKSPSGIIAIADMAVIVSPIAENEVTITTKSTVLTMETGKSVTVEAALQGAGLSPTDEYDLSWKSSDTGIAGLLLTERNITKGKSAYITAKNPGEAVITVTHPKAGTDLHIWLVIPRQNEVSITLDQTFIELYKDEGAVSVTATLVNGSTADYNNITWTAPKAGGQVIISVSKANGKTCNIVPRAVGRTTLRAQIPNGKYADCVVSVTSSAEITLETLAVHVNPGYTETIRYKTNPETAQVNWIAQSNTAADAGEFFTFQVNEAAKTISITGIALGGGSINAFFVSASGGTTARLQVYVEYTYEFELKTQGIITAEPRNGTAITIPFRVFPTDLEITAAVSDAKKMEVKSVSLNTITGNGEVVVTPLGEKNGLFVTLQATNPNDRVNTPIIRTQYINLRYQNLTITPVFDLEAGAFSYYDPKTNTFYLGDGEQALFHLKIAEENVELENLQIFWQSVNGAAADNLTVSQNGYISLAKEPGLSGSGEPLWRIGHGFDHLSAAPYYLVSREMKFRVWKTTYSGSFYTVQVFREYYDYDSQSYKTGYITEWRATQNQTDSAKEIKTADPNTAITGWYVYTNDWWELLDHKQRAYLSLTSESPIISATMGGFDGDEEIRSANRTSYVNKEQYDSSGYPTVLASYRTGDLLYGEVFYDSITPYVLSREKFEANPNYYRPTLSGHEYNWGEWWSSSNSWTKYFNAVQFHKYATATTSKNSAVLAVSYGQIKLTYKRFDGNPGENIINVRIQKRECEAYNNGKWREVSPGRWEQR